MTAEMVINKVIISDEAKADYVDIVGGEMPKADIKHLTEEYIDNFKHRFGGYYFRIKYLDETTDKMLILFFYQGQKIGKMQMWDLVGICEESDWSEALEEGGQIRAWLNSKLDPKEETDWVWDLRIKEAKRRKELAEEFEEEVESEMAKIKELLKNYKLNQARIAVGETEEIRVLKADMEFLDKCIEQLDADAMAVVTLLYKQGLSMSMAGKRLGYSKGGIQKKNNRAIEMLEILFSDRAN